MLHAFPDHFSGHADIYARYRPTYPETLFAWLAAQVRVRRVCWDCATGSGQAALSLRPYFDEIIATDASAAQLAAASPAPGVTYRRALAESSGLPDQSVDLICAAAAVHWFDHDRFYEEVRRVVRPGGVIAAWTYDGTPLIDGQRCPPLVALAESLAEDWPPQFSFVRERYENLPFPFPLIAAPTFETVVRWRFSELLGFIRSWSGYQRRVSRTGEEALAHWEAPLAAWWGDAPAREVRWTLAMRVGRLPGQAADRAGDPADPEQVRAVDRAPVDAPV